MKKIKPIIFIFLTLLFLNACSSVVEGLGGSKKKGSDQFLVEKKTPLVLPPSFGDLPEPGIKTKEKIANNKENGLSIEELIGQKSSVNNNKENNNLNKSIEKSIIEKINE
tara:strand:- start:135 stop:464 length:330 start_codon:yes stop_codon:yes gene_type:complete